MRENKRVTRSNSLLAIGEVNKGESFKKDDLVRQRVQHSIKEKVYNHALSLLKTVSPPNHWVMCKRAQAQFQMGFYHKALQSLSGSFKFERNGCIQCFELLLKLVQRKQLCVSDLSQPIIQASSTEDLPVNLQRQFRNLREEIERHPEGDANLDFTFFRMMNHYGGNGCSFRKVRVLEVSEDYRIAVAKKTIRPQQVIIFVPENQIITLETAKKSTIVSQICDEENRLKSPKHCILSIFLLLEIKEGEKSQYFNYFQCLPKKIQNFPIYYQDDLLQQLKGTSFLNSLEKKKTDLAEDYSEILSIVPQLKTFSLEDFIWARMIVSSRIFGIIIRDVKTDALVPIADMLNHKLPKMTVWYYSYERKGFVVQNLNHEIKEGSQIFDSYGTKCNSRFLLNYGFVQSNNEFNEVAITLKKYNRGRFSPPTLRLGTNLESEQFRTLLSYYRRSIETVDNPNVWNREQIKKKHVPWISKKNESEVWELIELNMKELLANYSTTIKKDERILAGNNVAFNLRNCVEIRLGEKRVLDFYLKMAKVMLQKIENPSKNLDLTQYDAYFKEIKQFLIAQ